MAARGGDSAQEPRVLSSPHHADRRSPAELAAIDNVDALHVTCVENHRSLVQMTDGIWVSTSGADDLDDEETMVEEVFQPLGTVPRKVDATTRRASSSWVSSKAGSHTGTLSVTTGLPIHLYLF
ncbi:hypothetical protein AB1Y20_002681 [Prymnesium parvum]|uniref:Uncharacterized protein n=1 Tax=Prymnesium parvum TaxID=97485 RepID=A0AB34JC33_PRYPA